MKSFALVVAGAVAVAAAVGCGGSQKSMEVDPAAPEAKAAPAAPAPETNEWDNGVVDTDGFMRIAWRLQTQENVFGFNVYRADEEAGPYEQINEQIIPGHGTTALPQEYAYIDSGIDQGRKYYYYVTEVTTTGKEEDITPKVGAVAKPRSFYVEKGHLEPEG